MNDLFQVSLVWTDTSGEQQQNDPRVVPRAQLRATVIQILNETNVESVFEDSYMIQVTYIGKG